MDGACELVWKSKELCDSCMKAGNLTVRGNRLYTMEIVPDTMSGTVHRCTQCGWWKRMWKNGMPGGSR